MAFQIRITPAALHAAAQRQRTVAETVAETSGILTSLAAELGEAWEGSASIQALNALDELRSVAGNIGDGAGNSAERLMGVAQAFEALDEGGPVSVAVLWDRDRFIKLVGCPMPKPQFPLMVIDNLRIVPEQVRAVAAKCKQVSDTYAETAAELNNMISELGKDWEGKAYNRFAEETGELASAFKRLSNAVDEFADRIRMMATRYEELDNSL